MMKKRRKKNKAIRKSLKNIVLDEDDLELIRENENLGIHQPEKVSLCVMLLFVPFIDVMWDSIHTFVDHVLFH